MATPAQRPGIVSIMVIVSAAPAVIVEGFVRRFGAANGSQHVLTSGRETRSRRDRLSNSAGLGPTTLSSVSPSGRSDVTSLEG